MMTAKAKRILRNITVKNEMDYLKALRKYYEENFENGKSDETFLLWIETCLHEFENV